MFTLLKKYRYQLLILLIVAIIGIANYRLGTFLTGWDNLQTELAPTLAIKRALFAVWQEYQSFGLVGGMAHASDLLRASVIWLMSLVLPVSIIRYAFHTGMWFIGAIGTYNFLQFARWRDGGRHTSELPPRNDANGWDEERQNLANWKIYSFIGALFYLLNFATIQLFFLPFEPFSIFFASLPWLIWIFLRTINHKPTHSQFSTYGLLFLINFLATPSFYVQTLFIVYMLVLGILGITHFSKTKLKTLVIAFSLIIAANLFWILPQVYFLNNGGSTTVNTAKINQVATENVYFQNKARGDIASFATFKGFYYDLSGRNKESIFAEWQKHFNNPPVMVASWSIFAVILLGITRKSTYRNSFLGIWLLCAFVLLSNTPIIATLHEVIRSNGLISQIFRAPFTKFAVPLALSSSFFFTLGIEQIQTFSPRLIKRLGGAPGGRPASELPLASKLTDGTRGRQNLTVLSSLIGCILVCFVSFPVLTGNLFSTLVRTSIPPQYFQTMDYFKTINKEQRIALLPQDSFWGWYHYAWGYTGSGFLWYGIEQPIVSPTFDVWSNKSESYLWEMKTALASQQGARVLEVLTKYNIHYIILDDSVLPTSSRQAGFSASRIKELLASQQSILLEKQFGSVSIYHVTTTAPFVSKVKNVPVVGPVINKTADDTAYSLLGDYQASSDPHAIDYYFPFLDLFSHAHPSTWHIQENPTTFSFKTKLPINTNDFTLVSSIESSPSLTASLQGAMLNIDLNKTLINRPDVTQTSPVQCNKLTVCLAYPLPDLSQEKGYIIKIQSEHISGQRLFFYVQNNTTHEAVIEDRLSSDTSYYILPPGNHFGRGYTIGFQNDSYAGTLSENSIANLEIYDIPYDQLKSLYFSRNNRNMEPSTTVVYHQSFDPGWKAYSNGKELTNHVIINNWANGWVGTHTNVTFFFLPQILEFIGLAVVGIIGFIGSIHFIIKRI